MFKLIFLKQSVCKLSTVTMGVVLYWSPQKIFLGKLLFYAPCQVLLMLIILIIYNVYRIVQCLINMSRNLNCYKISLECNDANLKWYNSMGFIREQGNSNFLQIRFN